MPQQEALRVIWRQDGAKRPLGETFLHELKECPLQAEHFSTHKHSPMKSSKVCPLLSFSQNEQINHSHSPVSGEILTKCRTNRRAHILPSYFQNEHILLTWRTISTWAFIPSIFFTNDTPKLFTTFSIKLTPVSTYLFLMGKNILLTIRNHHKFI